MRRLAVLGAVGGLLALPAAAGAVQGDLRATLDRTTEEAPVALRLEADLRGDRDGRLPPVTRRLELATPAGFTWSADGPSCSPDVVERDAAACPPGSRRGTAIVGYTYLAAGLRFPGTSESADVFHAGPGEVLVRVQVRQPASFVLVVEGKVAERPPQGATIDLDLSRLADFGGGTSVVLQRLVLDLPRAGEDAAPAPAPATTAKRRRTTCRALSRRTLRCDRAACSRRRGCRTTWCKGRGPRSCQPLRCTRDLLVPNYGRFTWRCRRVPAAPRRARAAQDVAAAPPSALRSGTCPDGGVWTFEARFGLQVGGSFSRTADVPCASAAAPSASPVPGAPDLPLPLR